MILETLIMCSLVFNSPFFDCSDHWTLYVMDKVDGNVGMIFDTGHANINQNLLEYFKKVAQHIIAYHVHDNDGYKDQHSIPGTGTINWQEIINEVFCTNNDVIFIFEVKDDGIDGAITAKKYIENIIVDGGR